MEELVWLVVIFALIGGGVTGCAEVYGRHQCSNYEQLAGKKTKWATLDACYIQTEVGWQRWDEYKIRAAASEGLKAK